MYNRFPKILPAEAYGDVKIEVFPYQGDKFHEREEPKPVPAFIASVKSLKIINAPSGEKCAEISLSHDNASLSLTYMFRDSSASNNTHISRLRSVFAPSALVAVYDAQIEKAEIRLGEKASVRPVLKNGQEGTALLLWRYAIKPRPEIT